MWYGKQHDLNPVSIVMSLPSYINFLLERYGVILINLELERQAAQTEQLPILEKRSVASDSMRLHKTHTGTPGGTSLIDYNCCDAW